MKAAGDSRGKSHARSARASSFLWAALLVLAATRAIASLAPGMALWGLDLPRFLPFGWGWFLWIIMAVALAPAAGRALAPACEQLGRALFHPAAPLAAAVASAVVVWALPDRTLFLGDFAMRSGTILTGKDPAQLFPRCRV